MKLSISACLIVGLLISCGGPLEPLTGKYANIIVSNNSVDDVIIALDDGSLSTEDNGIKNDQRVLLAVGESKVWNLLVTRDVRKVWLKLPPYGSQELELKAGETRSFTAGEHKVYDTVRVTFHNNDTGAHTVRVTPVQNGGLSWDGKFSTSKTRSYTVNARKSGNSGRRYLDLLLTEPLGTFRLSSAEFGNVANPTYLELGSGALNDREIVFKSGIAGELPYVFYTKISCALRLEIQKPTDIGKIFYQISPNNIPGIGDSGWIFDVDTTKRKTIEGYLDRISYGIRVDMYKNRDDQESSSSFTKTVECNPDTPSLNYRFQGDEIEKVV